MLTDLATHYCGTHVLVTGGMGFIGSHLTKSLYDLGASVTVLDLRTEEKTLSLLNDSALQLRPHVRVVRGDLADRSDVSHVLREGDFHFIFNLAASATVIETAVRSPFETIQVNTLGVVNLLEAARRLHTPPIRILHASTDKVYGEVEGGACEEKTPLRGIGVYDSSKLAADLFSRTYHEAYDLPTVVLRLCNIFGPADFNTAFRLIPRSMEKVYGQARPRSPELYFDSIQHWRDYLYVDDCIRAMLLVGCHPRCCGEVFNVSATQSISTPELIRQLVQTAAAIEREFDDARADAILELGITVRVQPPSPTVAAIKRQHIDGRKLKRATGFQPTVGFRDGLERTIRAYRRHYLGA